MCACAPIAGFDIRSRQRSWTSGSHIWCGTEQKYSIYPIQPALIFAKSYSYGMQEVWRDICPEWLLPLPPSYVPFSARVETPSLAFCIKVRGNQRGSCAPHLRSARSSEGTLEHLENLRTFAPNDKAISDLKHSIRDKIAEIEERESGNMAAD